MATRAAAETGAAYGSSLEHLCDEIRRVDLLVRGQIARVRQAAGEDAWRGVAISEPEVDALLARREMVGKSFNELKAILDAGVRSGELQPIEPEFLHIALVGMCQLFFDRRPLLEALFKRKVTPQKLANDYMGFVNRLVLGGLEGTSKRAPRRARKG